MEVRPRPKSFEGVLSEERKAILTRRRRARLLPEPEGGEGGGPVARDLVGLSLSGGGIRSASFNLGLLQALYRGRLLRHVDYLSTVSGGSYAGACFSSEVMQSEAGLYEGEISGAEGTEGAPAAVGDRFPLAQGPDGEQPPRVRELIHGGHYLGRPLVFLNRCAVGAVLVGLVALSGTLALAAIAAYLYRGLDSPTLGAPEALDALGFHGDILRAFFPFFVCGVAWIVSWIVAYWRQGQRAAGSVAKAFLVLSLVMLALAVAALVGTGDIDIKFLQELFGITPPRKQVNALSGVLGYVLLALLAVGLLPYLRPRDLFRSGMKGPNTWERRIFLVASYALLGGIPLLLFAIMARENISNYNALREEEIGGVRVSRRYDLWYRDFKDWSDAWRTIQVRARAGDRLSWWLLEWANHTPEPPNLRPLHPEQGGLGLPGLGGRDRVEESLYYDDRRISRDRSQSFTMSWLLLFGYAIGADVEANPMIDQVASAWDQRRLSEAICNHINEQHLWKPDFYRTAYPGLSDGEPSEADLVAWHRERSPGLSAGALRARADRTRELIRRGQELEGFADARHMAGFREWWGRWNRELKPAITTPQDERVLRQKAEELGGAAREGYEWLGQRIAALNWEILKDHYGDLLYDKSVVFAFVVQPKDQEARLRWFVWALGIFLVAGALVDLNATSLHAFYRNQLARIWITPRDNPLSRTETTSRGAPYHLLCGTLNRPGRACARAQAPEDVFTFGQAHCGSIRTGYLRAEDFLLGRYDLADAMAVSGAALSPVYPTNPLLALMLLLTNMRLGQWLPNPSFPRRLPGPIRWWLNRWPASPLRLLIGALLPPEDRFYCFVTDGGHAENLGLEQLLLRRCRVVIVSDASSDPASDFSPLMEVVRRARSERGIRIRWIGADHEARALDGLIPAPGTPRDGDGVRRGFSERHLALAHIEYPTAAGPGPGGADLGAGDPLGMGDESQGLLIYLKPTLTSDEDADLIRYWQEHAEFPHDPTSDQFYDPAKFESYRQLGFHIGEHLCEELRTLRDESEALAAVLADWGTARPHRARAHRRHTPKPRATAPEREDPVPQNPR